MAHVNPAGFEAQPAVDLRSDAELGLEQHAAAEGDLVGAEMFGGRAGMDSDAEAGADVDALAELRRQAERGVTRLARGVDGAEQVGLQRCAGDAAPAVTEHRVRAAFDTALVGRQFDVVDVEAAEQFAGMGGRSGREGQDQKQARASHRRAQCMAAQFVPPHPPACHARTVSFGASSIQTLSVRLSRITNSGTNSSMTSRTTAAQTGSLRARRKPMHIINMSEIELITLSPL